MNFLCDYRRRRLEKKQANEQYLRDLTTISGGPPGGSFPDKIGFYIVLVMNAISYDEKSAHDKAERMRIRRSSNLSPLEE